MSEFPSHLDFQEAVKFHAQMKSVCSDKNDVTLNLSHIEKISLSCIQVLMAAKKEHEKNERELLLEMSDTMRDVISDLGLQDFFQTSIRSK